MSVREVALSLRKEASTAKEPNDHESDELISYLIDILGLRQLLRLVTEKQQTKAVKATSPEGKLVNICS